MTIRFTHGYDLLFKIGTMVGGIMLVADGTDLLSPISDALERGLKLNDFEQIGIILMCGCIIGGWIGAMQHVSYARVGVAAIGKPAASVIYRDIFNGLCQSCPKRSFDL